MNNDQSKGFYEYLQSRGMETKQLEDDKIDETVVLFMKREDLDKYFPRYGDQIAALGFARRMDGNNDGNNDGATSFVSGKLSLMERLKSKAPSKDKRFEKGISNKNASRPERKIEIGWVDFNFEHSEFQQVRKPVGGTRRLTVAKDVTMSELLEIAKQIFFVDGKSAKGYLFEFEASLSDFSGNCYAPELTVADLSEKLFLTDLRVYLSTKCLLKENKRKRKKCSKKSSAASVASVKNDDSDDDFLPELNLRSSPVVTTSLTSNATVAMESAKDEVESSACGTSWVPTTTPTSNATVAIESAKDEVESSACGTSWLPTNTPTSNATVAIESAKDEVESSACGTSWLPTNTPTISFRSNRCTSSLPLSSSENAPTDNQPSNEEIVLSETEMIQQAIDASLLDISASRIVSLQDILSPLSAIGTKQQSIIVQRRFFLSSVLRAVQKGNFDFRKPLYVIFSGEEAEDHGGPRREFFKLLTRAIVDDMGIFEGTTSEKGFTYNLEFLRDGRYMLAGRFVWWSLSQGGPGIPALNSAVYAFMLGQPMVLNEALSAIGEPMRKNLDMIAAADSQTDFDEVMSSLSDWLLEMGIFRLKRNATERFVIISDLLKHFLFYRVKCGLEQFQKGLGPVWGLAVEHSELMKPLFVHSDIKLTAEVVRSLYTIKWSETGDNNRSLEDDTLYAWDCFLQEAECQDSEVTLSQILDFWTGADAVPPLGFEKKLTIDFYVLDPWQRLPTSSTCSMTLFLPRGVSDVDRLTSMLRMAIQESRGFGFI